MCLAKTSQIERSAAIHITGFICWLLFGFLITAFTAPVLGQSDNGATPQSTSIYGPTDLAYDEAGSLWIVESVGRSLRVLDLKPNRIRTIWNAKGADSYPHAVTSDHKGGVYVADFEGALLHLNGVSGASETLIESKRDSLERFDSLVLDQHGNLYMTQTDKDRVVVWNESSRHLSIIAGSKPGFAGDGGPAEQALLRFPTGLALTPDGNLLVADSGNYRIRKIDLHSGLISTVAGSGIKPDQEDSGFKGDSGPALKTVFSPERIAVDGSGNLFITAAWNWVLRVDAQTGLITAVAGLSKSESGKISNPLKHPGFADPVGIAVDSQGNLYVSEYVGNRIRRIDRATGVITTVAGNGLPHRADPIL